MSGILTPITEAMWKVAEEMYLESARDEQKVEYAGMTRKEKWATLEPFLLARVKTKAHEPWMNLLIEQLARKAGGE